MMQLNIGARKKQPVEEYRAARDLVKYAKGIADMFGIPQDELNMASLRGSAPYDTAQVI